MDYLQFTELRNSAREYFDKVEKGKSYVIVRKGKPIAKVSLLKSQFKDGKGRCKLLPHVREVTQQKFYDRSGMRNEFIF